MSLLMTWRMRHVPASGANVRPVRRAFWICAAMPTVKASTRRLGSDTDTWLRVGRVVDGVARRRARCREKSAVDSDVSATSS